MHFLKFTILLLLIAISFSNCTDDGAAAVESAATNICECTQPVLDLNQRMELLKRDGKIEALTELMEKAGIALNEAKACAKKNINDKMNKEMLKKALEKKCKIDQRMAADLVK